MFNNIMHLLSDVPLTLAAGWIAWFLSGALLAMWYRRAHADLEMHQAAATRSVARAKSGPRPSATTEPRVAPPPRPVTPKPHGEGGPFAVAVPRSKPAPIVVGDPFGELSTLLDQPTEAAAPAPVFRGPGESSIVNSAGSPVLRNNAAEPKP